MKKLVAIIAALAALLMFMVVFTMGDTDTSTAEAAPAPFQFNAQLSGAQEVSEVVTATSGNVRIDFATNLSKAQFQLNVFDGVAVTAAHFHCGRAGVGGGVVVTLFAGPTQDANGELASATLTNADVVGGVADCGLETPVNNIASLAAAMDDGRIYVNVHSELNPGGEVRGQLLGQ